MGPRPRNVAPQPIMETIVEKAKLDHERKKEAISVTLYEARETDRRAVSEADVEEFRAVVPADSRMRRLLRRKFLRKTQHLNLLPVEVSRHISRRS